MKRWIEISGLNAFISGKQKDSLRIWGQKQAWEEAKNSYRFKNCIHKPAHAIKPGDTIFVNRDRLYKFYKVANNFNINGKSQKIYLDVERDPEEDVSLHFPTVIYRQNTLILVKLS